MTWLCGVKKFQHIPERTLLSWIRLCAVGGCVGQGIGCLIHSRRENFSVEVIQMLGLNRIQSCLHFFINLDSTFDGQKHLMDSTFDGQNIQALCGGIFLVYSSSCADHGATCYLTTALLDEFMAANLNGRLIGRGGLRIRE
ncbi:hypothetical protein BgiMline_022136 [Biomphalaria glabrata]